MSLEIQLASNEHWVLFNKGQRVARGHCDASLLEDRIISKDVSIIMSHYSVIEVKEYSASKEYKLKYLIIVTHQDGEWNHTVVKE